MRIGFIGLGHIGAPMARLLAASFDLGVYDVAPAARDGFKGIARVAASPADLGRDSEIVGVCVRDDEQVRATVEGPQGLFETMGKNSVILIHSTIRAATVCDLAETGAERGIIVIDAPVTRTTGDDTKKFIGTMVGGDPAVLERVRPVLDAFATLIVPAGPLGGGMVLKAANNLVTYIEFIALQESMRLVKSGGVDAALLRKVMTENGNLTRTMASMFDMVETGRARMGDQAFDKLVASAGNLAEKDIDVALSLARDQGVELPITAEARQFIRGAFEGR